MKRLSKEGGQFKKRIYAATIILSSIVALIVVTIFNKNLRNLIPNCSFLDPVIIDIGALFASTFLIVEGMWSIKRFPAPLPRQIFRMIRVLFGVAIFTIHVLQLKYG
jgi:hypothetical protein